MLVLNNINVTAMASQTKNNWAQLGSLHPPALDRDLNAGVVDERERIPVVIVIVRATAKSASCQPARQPGMPSMPAAQGMTRPSIHSIGNFVYKHVDIYFLAGGQVMGSTQ